MLLSQKFFVNNTKDDTKSLFLFESGYHISCVILISRTSSPIGHETVKRLKSMDIDLRTTVRISSKVYATTAKLVVPLGCDFDFKIMFVL